MPVTAITGQTVFGSSTSGTTTQLDNNFLLFLNALNEFNQYKNYLADAGVVNAYVVTLPSGMTGAIADGLIIQMKVKTANTGASTLNYNANGASPITDVSGAALTAGMMPVNAIVQLQYSSGAGAWLLQTPLTSTAVVTTTKVPVRQCILACPLDANGFSTMMPTTSAGLTVTASNATATAPIVVTAANGTGNSGQVDTVGVTSGNLTWSNLTANAVNFLGVVVNANGTLSTFSVSNANGVQPSYSWGNSATTGNGNYSFSIQEMTMRVGNGSATAQTNSVFVGEANCNSNTVVTCTGYAPLGRYDSGFTATLPNTATLSSKNHNIGTTEIVSNLVIECTTTDAGYSVGDRLINPGINDSGSIVVSGQPGNTYKTAYFTTGSAGTIISHNKSSGVNVTLTLASWKWKITSTRAW